MPRIFLRIFIFIGLFFATFANAVAIDTDTFDTDMDGWSKVNSNDVVYWDSGRLFIKRDDSAQKTYDFGSSYANLAIVISLDATEISSWESADDLEIYLNGSKVIDDTVNGTEHYSFPATLDGNGRVTLRIKPNTSTNAESVYIDNVVIDCDLLVSIGNASITEGNSGTKTIDFPITLNASFSQPVSVDYTTVDGTATAGSDYVTSSGTVTIPAGQTSGTISVTINGDTAQESDETFKVNLSNPTNATLGNTSATGTILDDDTPPAISVANTSVTEGNSATQNMIFTLTLDHPFGENISVDYTTADGTATAGDDYAASSGTVTIPAGQTSGSITITVNGDTKVEPNETLTLKLSNPTNATLSNTSAVGTIINDDQVYLLGVQDFELINPQETRNILGNYAIAGNTVECITTSTSSFNGTCTNSHAYNDNGYMSKYIDIDSHSGTWNSTSSSITLPDTYEEDDGDDTNGKEGILWAGLFWQGNVNNYLGSSNTQRRAIATSATSFNYTNITSNSALDVRNTDANKVLLKVDNDPSYTEIKAERLHYDDYYTVTDWWSTNIYGTTYAGFADVTQQLRGYSLSKGTHTFTVANITANEGHENSLGNYAGWSLVVIYKENAEGDTKNISIYEGFTTVSSSVSRNVTISGFKLPSSGDIFSQFSSFAGEGEDVYSTDHMRINGNNMPGAIDKDNIFDARVAGIDRDTSNWLNALNNTNGIDIDRYDTSSIMTALRDVNPDINSITLSLDSTWDYYTPSMIAFATDLYKPELCYDFAGLIGGYIPVPIAEDRTFTVSKWGDDPFYLKIFIRSEEADFNLVNTGLKVILNDINGSSLSTLDFDISKTTVSPNSTNGYIATGGIPDDSSDIFSIGEFTDKHAGGTIGVKENTYAKAAFDFGTSNVIEGKFDIEIHTSLQLDALNPDKLVQYTYSSTNPKSLPICERNYVYDPIWLYFNVEPPKSDRADNSDVEKYSLPTQVVGRTFDVEVASYTGDEYNQEEIIGSPDEITVSVELINAGGFQNDKDAGYDSICSDFDQAESVETFVHFNNDARRPLSLTSDVALESAAFRVLVLTKEEGDGTKTIVPHHCQSTSDGGCFHYVYENNYADLNATNYNGECDSTAPTDTCYNYLRENYATSICSRDNFAIRPKGFRINIQDNDEGNATMPKDIVSNNGDIDDNNASLAAGYTYQLGLTALAFDDNTTALGYYNERYKNEELQNAPLRDAIALAFNDNTTACNDTNTTTYNYPMQNGQITSEHNGTEEFSFDNVGRYNFWMDDTKWTRVDQKDYEYKTKFNNDKKDDCVPLSTAWQNDVHAGCSTSSIINDDTKYNDIDLRFNPYGFDLGSVYMTNTPNNNKSWLYTNNLKDDPNMGVLFDGNVTAIAKGGTVTTNFVKECAATDVNLELNITSTPEEGNITAFSLDDASIKHIGLNNIIIGADDNTTDANGTQATIPKEYFTKDYIGSSEIDLRYNYDRENDKVTNPILATFHSLTASAPDANASAKMDDNRTPEGINSYEQNRTFLKGRVYTANEDYVAQTYDDGYATTFQVLAYCDINSDINCSTAIPSASLSGPLLNWYYMTAHTSNTDDGNIEELDDNDSSGATMTPYQEITFDNNASSGAVVIAYPQENRDKRVTIVVYPYQWLKYHVDSVQDGNPFFMIDFFGNVVNDWTGVGETGNKIDINASRGSEGRTSW